MNRFEDNSETCNWNKNYVWNKIKDIIFMKYSQHVFFPQDFCIRIKGHDYWIYLKQYGSTPYLTGNINGMGQIRQKKSQTIVAFANHLADMISETFDGLLNEETGTEAIIPPIEPKDTVAITFHLEFPKSMTYPEIDAEVTKRFKKRPASISSLS